jgi:carboxylesterase type B
VLDATKLPPICAQYDNINSEGLQKGPILGQEDCLYLNVYVPEKAYKAWNATEEKKEEDNDVGDIPVMVWIHGGGFLVGTGGPQFYGPDKIMNQENVILVNFYFFYFFGATVKSRFKNSQFKNNS